MPEDVRRLLYGRRQGPQAARRQARLVQTLLPQPAARSRAARAHRPRGTVSGTPSARCRLEIGFGGGEHLAHAGGTATATSASSAANPSSTASPSSWPPSSTTALDNVRIHDGRCARRCSTAARRLPVAGLLLFPDPWPKRRHHKRRFVNDGNLDALARVLKPRRRAALRHATWPDYVDWTLTHSARTGGLSLDRAPGGGLAPTARRTGRRRDTRRRRSREGRTPCLSALSAGL